MVAEAAGSRRRIAVSAVLGARAESTAATLGALDGASEAMPAARASVDARPFVYYIVSSRMRRRSVKQATCGWTASRRNATQLRAHNPPQARSRGDRMGSSLYHVPIMDPWDPNDSESSSYNRSFFITTTTQINCTLEA